MKLEQKYQTALDKFTEKYKKDPNVVGIILSGSIVHSKPDKNSDLDVFIVEKENKTRERGNVFIDGVEIEYFKNPLKQIETYFDEETMKSKKNPATLHMFANSMIVFERGDYLRKFISRAKKALSKKREKLSKFELEQARYFIDDIGKDLEDVYLKKDWFSFEIIAHEITDKAINYFYAVKRLHREKSKRLENDLEKLDKRLKSLVSNVLLEKDYARKYAALNRLIAYTEKLLGGKRPEHWVLKSKCTYMKK